MKRNNLTAKGSKEIMENKKFKSLQNVRFFHSYFANF